jgi:hypothetical protein
LVILVVVQSSLVVYGLRLWFSRGKNEERGDCRPGMVSMPKGDDVTVMRAIVQGLLREIGECGALLREEEHSKTMMPEQDEQLAHSKSEVDSAETLMTGRKERRRRLRNIERRTDDVSAEVVKISAGPQIETV